MMVPPSHPLSGCLAKIDRAEEQIQHLDTEITTILESNVYRIDQHHDTQAGQYSFIAVGPQVPLRLAVLAGEVVHHLRSVLDHLLWQLVIVHGQRKPGRGNEFPVCKSAAEYKEACRGGKIKGISPIAAALIQELQPYHRGAAYESHPLWVLHDLDITDKHRLLVVVAASVSPEHIWMSQGDVSRVELLPPFPSSVQPTIPGTVIASFSLHPSDANVKMEGKFPVQIVLEKFGVAQHYPVIPGLKQLHNFALDAIQRFAREFTFP